MSHAWYPRYPGDYLRDTQHLSLVQHGAYGVLLDSYYCTGKPLPIDRDSLYRIARAFTPEERLAVDSVVVQFFVQQDDGWHNRRADVELAKQTDFQKERSESGRKGAEKRWSNSANGSAITQPMAKPMASTVTTTTTTKEQSQEKQNRPDDVAQRDSFSEKAEQTLLRKYPEDGEEKIRFGLQVISERAYNSRSSPGSTKYFVSAYESLREEKRFQEDFDWYQENPQSNDRRIALNTLIQLADAESKRTGREFDDCYRDLLREKPEEITEKVM